MPKPIDPRGIMAREWAVFAHKILDPMNAGEIQRTEMRRAFYAGAFSMFDIMTRMAGPDEEDDSVGAARIEEVHQELLRFAKALQTGHA